MTDNNGFNQYSRNDYYGTGDSTNYNNYYHDSYEYNNYHGNGYSSNTYGTEAKEREKKNRLFTIVLIAGIIVVVIGMFLGGIFGVVSRIMYGMVENVEEERKEMGPDTETCKGKIRLEDNGTTIVYRVDDEEYEIYYSVSNSEFRDGSSVKVYYDPEDPEIAMAPELLTSTYNLFGKIFGIIAICIGVAIAIFGMVFVVIGVVGKKMIK